MTQVSMHFVTPSGAPFVDAPVHIRMAANAVSTSENLVVMTQVEEFVTDSEGKLLVSLINVDRLYQVIAYDEPNETSLKHDFYVPLTVNPDTVLDLVDLIIPCGTTLTSMPYDEIALIKIMTAKLEAETAATTATSAVGSAEESKDAAEAAELAAKSSAQDAKDASEEALVTLTDANAALTDVESKLDTLPTTLAVSAEVFPTNPKWESVPKVTSTNTPLNGDDGPLNKQAKVLVDRTEDLRTNVGRSLINFGAIPGGFDCGPALLRAFQSKEAIYIPLGDWYIKSQVEYTGPIYLHGPGNLVMDTMTIFIDQGHQSTLDGFGLDTESVPWILQRWNDNNERQAPVMVQSKTANGYQWTVNDLDFTPPENQRTTLSSGFIFTNSNSVSVKNLRSVYGMCIYFYDCNYCTVDKVRGPMGWGRWQGGIYFGSVDPQVNKPNYGNSVSNTDVWGSSFSGVQFYNSRFPSVRGTQVLYVGESGIKLGQNDGTPNNRYAHCFDGTFEGNTVFRPHYDCYDIAQNYPHTGVEDARHKITNNTAIEADGCGYYLDGSSLNVNGNSAYGCGKGGFLLDTNDSKILNNVARNCNQGNHNSGQHQMSISGNDNTIENNTARRSNEHIVGYNGYVTGARNKLRNNDGRDNINDSGSMFFCGSAVATEAYGNRKGALNSNVPITFQYDAPGDSDNQVVTTYKIRDSLTNNVVRERILLDVGTNTQECGGWSLDVAYKGVMRQGLRVSAGGDFGAQLSTPLVDFSALNYSVIPIGQTGMIWALNQANGVLTAVVKFSDGNVRKLEFSPVPF